MKGAFVFVVCLCAFAAALPRRVPEEDQDEGAPDTEVFVVPLSHASDLPRRPNPLSFDLADELAPPPFEQHPFFRFSPWGAAPPAQDEQVDDFMTQMQEMLKEMRKQLTDLLHHSHASEFPGETGVIDTKIGGGDDLPKNKTTSTTKIIDGHVVTVNETTYSSGDDNIGAVFRIKVVEVKPSETPDETEGEVKPVESEGDEKSDEPSDKTEGPQEETEAESTTSKSELIDDEHEETNEIPNMKVVREWSPDANEIDESEDYIVDEFKPSKKANYHDLSGDTRVNDYLADRGQSQELVMIEPEAEFINSNANGYYHYDRVPQRLQANY